MTDIPEGLPPVVKVGYRDYRIVAWSLIEGEERRRYGECAQIAREIRVCFGHGLREGSATLLHEIMHAVSAVNDLTTEQPDHMVNEERAVSVLSNGLAGVWRDNPAVFEWIAKGLCDGAS